jgi:hypothetical protein
LGAPQYLCADAYRRKTPTTGIDCPHISLLATQDVVGIDGDFDRECAVNNLECKNDWKNRNYPLEQ